MKKSHQYLLQLKDWGKEMERIVTDFELQAEKENVQKLLEDINKSIEHGLYQEENIKKLQEQGKSLLMRLGFSAAIPYGEHKLPPLPYAYDALEPYISEEIMRLHHDIHHQSYVDGLNEAEKHLYKMKMDKSELKHWLREQAFHGSGHYLHSIFWKNMSPHSSKKPVKAIKKQIESDFGSWEDFKHRFTETALSVEGAGWAVLFWHPMSNKLGIQSLEKHQLFDIAGLIPLLVLDMWEHAYYLQYKTNKKTYVNNWWNVVNWEDVNDRFIRAKGK